MPDDNGYYPPVQYQPIWLILGIAIIAAIVAWYVFVWWYSKRKHRPKPPPPVIDPAITVEELRSKYFRLIGEVEDAFAQGELSRRVAHQRLGILVRAFAWESRGVKAQSMTLDDLERARVSGVSDAVELYYPAEFAAMEQGDVSRSAEAARQVVGTWH